MSKQNLVIKALPQVTTKSALAPLLRKAYYLNWSSAFCNKGISTEVIQNAVTQLENEGNYVSPEEFIKALANVLAQKPDIRKDRKAGVGLKASTLGTYQPKNSKVVTIKLPKKEVEKTQLLPTHEIAKLVADIRRQQDELKEVIDKHDFKTAETLQTQLDSTQSELNNEMAPFITQEQTIASTTQEVEELKDKARLARRHYSEVIQQLAALRIEAINAEREANVLEQNLDNRKEELRKLKLGQYSLSDDYTTLDLETGILHGTQLVHMPTKMVEILDSLRDRLANADAVNGDEFVERAKLTKLRTLRNTYADLGMPMPADIKKELEKIERGYQRWLAEK